MYSHVPSAWFKYYNFGHRFPVKNKGTGGANTITLVNFMAFSACGTQRVKVNRRFNQFRTSYEKKKRSIPDCRHFTVWHLLVQALVENR